VSGRDRQLLLLAVLVVVFVGVIGRQLLPSLAGGPIVASNRAPLAGPAGAAAAPVEIAELRLDALEHKPATYRPGRDPFRFGSRPEPPPAPRPKPAPKRPPAPERRPPRQQEPAPPQPPAIEFVYLGSFGLPGREIAVFSDGKEILNAFAGDVLQQEFVVRSIGYESADIGFVNFPDAPAKRLAVGG
jgi:hypothetical protein